MKRKSYILLILLISTFEISKGEFFDRINFAETSFNIDIASSSSYSSPTEQFLSFHSEQPAASYYFNDSIATAVETTTASSPTEDYAANYYKFRPNQLIAPGAMLAAGVAGVWAFDGIKRSVHHHFSAKPGHTTSAESYLRFVPAAAYIGLGFIPGVKHRSEGWRDRVMAGATAYLTMVAVSNIMKVSFRERRPNSDERNSFPSGHTAAAFTGAELMRLEYGNWIGLAGYAVATTVGALRIYNDRHWINDVIGGAAIGIISARIGYWLLPLERRLFHLDKQKSKTDIAVMPLVGNSYGMSVAVSF